MADALSLLTSLGFAGEPSNGITLDDVGPRSDGTFAVPSTAQQINVPSNTAGNPPATDPAAFDILKFGAGLANSLMAWDIQKTAIDKRYEATNGGLFAYGRPALVGTRTATGGVSPGMALALAVVVGVLVLGTHKG